MCNELKSPLFIGFLLILALNVNIYSQNRFVKNLPEVHVIIDKDTVQNAWLGGLNSTTVSTLDANLDGIEDLIVYDRQHKKALVFIQQNNRFIFSEETSNNLPNLSKYALTYDYNKDGKKDLFTSTALGIKAYQNISTQTVLGFKNVADPISTYYPPGYSNMNIGTSDVPSLVDIDNDGDMDILHFNNADGVSVIWERNMSVEKYGNPDSLDFKQTDDCWGGFQEQTCTKYYFGFDCKNNFRLEHVGAGAVQALDMDNDGDKEVLLGKADCQNLNFLENKGNVSSAFFNKLSSSFPSSNPVDPLPYPLPFLEDVDFDGIKDLIVTMGEENVDSKTDLANSIWWYKNTGSNVQPIFSFQSKSFLQNTMIDLGQNTQPSLHDFDSDGDLDLFAGNSTNLSTKGASIHLFENIGTPNNATFQLKDTNFFDQAKYSYDELNILFEDLNNDGKNDLILSSQKDVSFKTELFLTSSNGTLDFQNPIILDFGLNEIASFAFVDTDNDNLKDALVGKLSGELYLYKNTGTTSLPKFELTNTAFGGIEPNDFFTNTHLSLCVSDMNTNGELDLITWDDLGEMKLYSDFLTQTSPYTFTIVDDGSASIKPFGQKLRFTTGDLNNDSKPELIVGNDNGGLQFYFANSDPNLLDNNAKESITFDVYPNPNKGDFSIKSSKKGLIELKNLIGQSVYKCTVDKNELRTFSLDITKGLYFISIDGGSTKKIIVE